MRINNKKNQLGCFSVKLFALKSLRIHTQPSEMTQRDPPHPSPSFSPKSCSRISARIRALVLSRYRTIHHHGVRHVAAVGAASPTALAPTSPLQPPHRSVSVSVISRGRAEGDLRPSPEAHPGATGRRSPLLLAAVPCVVRTGELASAFTPEGRPGHIPFLAATNKAAASVCVRDFV